MPRVPPSDAPSALTSFPLAPFPLMPPSASNVALGDDGDDTLSGLDLLDLAFLEQVLQSALPDPEGNDRGNEEHAEDADKQQESTQERQPPPPSTSSPSLEEAPISSLATDATAAEGPSDAPLDRAQRRRLSNRQAAARLRVRRLKERAEKEARIRELRHRIRVLAIRLRGHLHHHRANMHALACLLPPRPPQLTLRRLRELLQGP